MLPERKLIISSRDCSEKDEKLDGDAAMNKFFSDIYSSADEDMRRAMNKSFAQSNGTVLSTNWKEVGTKKVESTMDMELKKWEYKLITPTRNGNFCKTSPKALISPTRVCNKSQNLSTAAKLRRSFSPSRLAMRLVSPMKSRKSVAKCDDHEMVSGLK
ncbi:unnamed protein product [Arabidopsis arenosa]|uniref:SGS domain-containing protein n=1 Tax=Arabidopsis arenosa TaxID=38785 RepID=A0A8S2B066_ARAAE|nr:unnamed protein product [Arabidopsis arenosa]